MKKTLLLSLLIFAGAAHVFAQYYTNQNKNWAFGFWTGINFTSGSPATITTDIATNEGCASVSDLAGNLLFYSDGLRVWDHTGTLMPHGAAIVGFATWSSTQGAAIVPVIGNANQYYLFSIEQWDTISGDGRIAYSIVDMTLNGGLGDLVYGSTGTVINRYMSEKMAAVAGDNCDVWLIVHRRDTAAFLAYDITASGIAAPVVSYVGSFSGVLSYGIGVIKASPNRRKIVSQTGYYGSGSGTELYDFDPATGVVSNCQVLDTSVGYHYGAEFSPDNTKLYADEEFGPVLQYDISLSTTAAIIASKTMLDTATPYPNFGDLKLAPDGKIYITSTSTGNLKYISAPNTAGTACDYTSPGFTLTTGFGFYGLPNVVISVIPADTFHTSFDTTVCLYRDSTVIINAHDTGTTSGYLWNDGATTTRTKSITATGTYWVSIYNGCSLTIDTIHVSSYTVPSLITGTAHICAGAMTLLRDSIAGGLWTSGSTIVATVGSSSGFVHGLSAGTSVISYTLGTGCAMEITVTVSPLPSIITGTQSVCAGATTTLSDSVGEGVWSSSNPTIATVGSGSGVVTGVSAGAVVITYTLPTGCARAVSVMVNALPAPITGPGTVCDGYTITLHDATTGGVWSSGEPWIASVGSATGAVTGVSGGTATITYALIFSGCFVTYSMSTSVVPAITGITNLCSYGSTVRAYDSDPGGAWTASLVTITDSGLVTSYAAGIGTITYTLPDGCMASAMLTVNPSPAHISGLPAVCITMGTVLTDMVGGGSWTSSIPAVATIGSASGVLSPVSTGVTVITYTLPDGCYTTKTETVTAVPGIITGGTMLCAGTTISLSDMPYGGTWTSASPGVAAIGSASGLLTGLSGGTAAITYASADCAVGITVTVHPSPSAISGSTLICIGTPATLSDGVFGGTWISSNPLAASIGVSSGVVTGVAAGTVIITYTLAPGHCSATTVVTVSPAPFPISGVSDFCGSGLTSTFGDAIAGGLWSSSNTSVATVGSSSGIVTSVGSGTATITYALPGGCYTTFPVTVNASDTTACSACHVLGAYTPLGTSGIISTSIGAGNYYISTNVTILGTITFTDAVILIAPGKTVSVNATSSLTLSGCHLFSCGSMWQGFVLQTSGGATGSITLQGDAGGTSTLIEDAINGVDAEMPAGPVFITSTNTVFNRNNTGIKIAGYSPATVTATIYTGLFVDNTVFTSRSLASSPGSWPGAEALKTATVVPSVYTAPYAVTTYSAVPCFNSAMTTGISLNGVGVSTWPNYGSVQVGYPTTSPVWLGINEQNLFENLNYGIYALNANVTAIGNDFANIAKSGNSGGTGIYASMTDGHYYQLTVQAGVTGYGIYTTYSPNYFWSCPYGVYALNYYHVNGLSSQMVTTQSNALNTNSGFYGYYVQTPIWDTLNLSLNTIINVANGVAVKLAGGPLALPAGYAPGQITISNNNIRAKYSTSTLLGTAYVDKPIWVDNTVLYTTVATFGGSAPPAPTSELNTDQNTITNAYNGIYINGPAQVATSNGNTISMMEYPITTNPQYGVTHYSCNGGEIMLNTITGTDYTNKNWNGVLNWYSSGFAANCNTVTNVGKGFEFNSTSLNCHWLNNTMTNNGKGLALGGVIGTQGNTALGGNTCLNKWESTGSFAWSTLTYPQTFTQYGVSPVSSTLIVRTGTNTDPIYNGTSEGGLASTICAHTYGCYMVGTIPDYTGSGNGLTLSSEPVVPFSCSSPTGHVTGGLIPVAQALIPYSQWATEHNWTAQYALWETLLQDTALADTSAILTAFMAMANNSRFALFTQIESYLASSDTTDAQLILNNFSVDSLANAEADTATGVQMADDTTADAIVVNYREYFQVYIHYLEGLMTGSDSTQVGTLASLCPITGGGVVFKAQALFDVLYDTLAVFPNSCSDSVVFDSMAMRQSAPGLTPALSTGGEGVTNKGQQYTLFPNPNDGNFMLQQYVPDDLPVLARIWNATGISVFSDDLHFIQRSCMINLTHLPPGLYLLDLINIKGEKFTIKFIVGK